jgi:hypothetical protein
VLPPGVFVAPVRPFLLTLAAIVDVLRSKIAAIA